MPRKYQDCECSLCVPVEGADPCPVWGYDRNQVHRVRCMRCREPIGDRPYVEDTTFARFGDMSFYHRSCMSPGELRGVDAKNQRMIEARKAKREKQKKGNHEY